MLPACNLDWTMSQSSLSWEMSCPVANFRSEASFSLNICALYPFLPILLVAVPLCWTCYNVKKKKNFGGLKCKTPVD